MLHHHSMAHHARTSHPHSRAQGHCSTLQDILVGDTERNRVGPINEFFCDEPTMPYVLLSEHDLDQSPGNPIVQKSSDTIVVDYILN